MLTQINTFKVSENVIQMKLTLGYWDGNVKVPDLDEEAARTYGIDRRKIKTKLQTLDDDERKNVSRCAVEIREYFNSVTVPFQDGSWRAARVDRHAEIMSRLQELIARFNDAVHDRLSRWSDITARAREITNGLWPVIDFPNHEEAERRHHVGIKTLPVADADAVKLAGLDEETVEKIKASTRDALAEQMRDAQADIIGRLVEVIRHMREKLGDKKAIFRDTLVSNIADVARLVPMINLTGDKRLDEIAKKALDELTAYDPEDLRKNASARFAVAHKADGILDDLNNFGV